MEAVWGMLPKPIAALLQESLVGPHEVEEIRIRISRPLEVIARGKARLLPYEVTKEDGVHLLNKLSHYSMYAVEEELKRGFITIEGGHRVGLAGKVITEGGKVKAIRDVSSFNIRIAKEQVGIAEPLLPYVYDGRRFRHTMIIGSPQTGKTTLLRDAARLISSGTNRMAAQKVAIVDERSEIAGCVKGVPQFSFGPRLDVLDACPKAEGMMMMIRSMSPDVIIVDEIGREEDSEAVLEAANAGVSVWTTVHGRSLKDVWQRPTLRAVMEQKVFERFVELTSVPRPGSIRRILDADGSILYERAVASR
ncbi:stage III sporulation protein AA [Geobacillus sp. FSL W8-0032]|uniref:stage III sporulation protein AA n=1 Tax=unclassified Geobacillus TaxID=2642459 RepID=UPI0005399877